MRTTLTIDDDILDAVKEVASREGRTAGEVLSDLARAQLTAPHAKAQDARHRNGLLLLPEGKSPVSNTLVNRLREEEGV